MLMQKHFNYRITGGIPEKIGNLHSLEELYLYNNTLSGSCDLFVIKLLYTWYFNSYLLFCAWIQQKSVQSCILYQFRYVYPRHCLGGGLCQWKRGLDFFSFFFLWRFDSRYCWNMLGTGKRNIRLWKLNL